jgi:YHS domain-containing protein
MTRWQWLGVVAFVGAILLASWLSSVRAEERLEYPIPGPCSCVPNVREFCHYEPRWRRWPGEVRLEQINPHAPVAEPLPTPEGREIVPPPKATGAPQETKPPQAKQPQQPSAHEESTLPLGATPRPMEGTNLPSTPGGTENKPGSTKPTIEGELPGLLPEPEPNKPSNPVPPANLPAKPPAKEPPKSSLREDGPKLTNSFDVAAVHPAQPADARFGPQKVWQKDNRPPAPATRDIKADAVVALTGNMEPERNASLPRAHQADAIGVTPGSSAASIEPAAYAMAESPPKPAAVSRVALPSVALAGYCPVELSENGRWVLGDLRWTVVHQGWIYRLSGAEQRRQFLANPDRFAPVNSGNDAVLSLTESRSVPGQTAHCAIYNNRLYMFSSAATQAEFNRNPERYVIRR